jgi:hypothetical protein
MDWEVQSVQCAVFTVPKLTLPEAFSAWVGLTGAAPTAFNQNPPGAPPGSSANGVHDGVTVTVGAQHGRLDLIISPLEASTERPERPPTFKSPDLAFERALGFVDALVGTENPVRVAFVLNLLRIHPNAEEASEHFAAATGLAHITGATDLSYQLNVPTAIGGAGWQMNRLVRWGTAIFQFMEVDLTGSADQTPAVSSRLHVSTLTIDVNTALRPIPLGGSQARSSLRKLASEAREIMSTGHARLSK